MIDIPRIRMFAGPNGSGKSTIKSVLRPELLGFYINPDEIEQEIRERDFLDMKNFGVDTTEVEILSFFNDSVLLAGAELLDEAGCLRFSDDKLQGLAEQNQLPQSLLVISTGRVNKRQLQEFAQTHNGGDLVLLTLSESVQGEVDLSNTSQKLKNVFSTNVFRVVGLVVIAFVVLLLGITRDEINTRFIGTGIFSEVHNIPENSLNTVPPRPVELPVQGNVVHSIKPVTLHFALDPPGVEVILRGEPRFSHADGVIEAHAGLEFIGKYEISRVYVNNVEARQGESPGVWDVVIPFNALEQPLTIIIKDGHGNEFLKTGIGDLP